MDTEHLTSASFWEDDGHFAAGTWEGELPELGGCGGSVIFRTSGSTGNGKWIVLEKRAMRVSARAVNGWLGVAEDSRWGLALPTDHVGGFAILARTFEAGCEVSLFQEKWDAVAFVEWVRREAVTHVSLVPTQLHDLVEAKLSAPESLKAVVIGGGRLSETLGQAGRDRDWPVLASYGMTEAGSQIATQHLEDLRNPFSEAKMEVLPIWEVGETANGLLRLRGDALFTGTLEDGRFRKRKKQWFTTSDRVAITGNAIKPLGRADSLVKVMGELVDLEEVERRFMVVCAGRITEGAFAIVAVPDGRMEHALIGVFEGDMVPLCVDEYNSQASGPERMTESFAIEEFPRSSLGKLRRGRLAEIYGKM